MEKIALNLAKIISPKLLILAILLFSSAAYCQEPEYVSRIQESSRGDQLGLSPRLTAEDLTAYSSWIDQAVSDLEDTQGSVKSISNPRTERDIWVNEIKKIVPQSPFEKDTLFRWALNRALKIEEILENAKSASMPSTVDQEVRVLRKSVDLALSFANQTFSRNQDAVTDLPFQEFAVAEADALLWIDENELDTQAQLQVGLNVLGWMHVDLWRDPQSKDMAQAIVRIADFLQKADTNTPSVTMTEIRTVYFDSLTDLKDSGTRVGEKIKQAQLQKKTVKLTKRVHL